ncbi:hypothetical protein TrST_g5295 [Triparma strigata]|uniref:Kinesin motor domain-containing protein n=1 Tax=Triparma strigata TaxID=1606541 RepID=A0A9W7BSI9_9STRA|nr:hypothetical protein TrST_g5295 [Triparma strigata]
MNNNENSFSQLSSPPISSPMRSPKAHVMNDRKSLGDATNKINSPGRKTPVKDAVLKNAETLLGPRSPPRHLANKEAESTAPPIATTPKEQQEEVKPKRNSVGAETKFGFKAPVASIPVKSSGYGRPSTGSTSSVKSSGYGRTRHSVSPRVPDSNLPPPPHVANSSSYADAIRQQKRESSSRLSSPKSKPVPNLNPIGSSKKSNSSKSHSVAWQSSHPPAHSAHTPVSALKRSASQLVGSLVKSAKSHTKNFHSPRMTPGHGSHKKDGKKSQLSNAASGQLFPSEVLHFDPLHSEIRNHANQIFGSDSGTSDEEIKKLISMRGSLKSWELKKKVEESAKNIKLFKQTLSTMQKQRSRFKALAIEAELAAKKNWASCAGRVLATDKENEKLRIEVKSLSIVAVGARDSSKDAERELKQYKEKVEALEVEIAPLKGALAAAERAHTEVACKLAAAEGSRREATKQADSWRQELSSIETEKTKAVKLAEESVKQKVKDEMDGLQVERDELKKKVEAFEGELSRLVDGGEGGIDSILGVKLELEKLRSKSGELEKELISKEAQLTTALRDLDVAKISADEKEKNFTQLMMSIGEIQNSGQRREDEQKERTIKAELKLEESEKIVAASASTIATLTAEKTSLESSLSIAQEALKEANTTLAEVKAELASFKSDSSGLEAQLSLEKELRSRAEEKEKEEKNERIAVSAQMMAMTTEMTTKEAQIREEGEKKERELESKIVELQAKLEEKSTLCEERGEQIRGLESEKQSLREAMQSQEFQHAGASAEEIARLKGEVEVLKEKCRNAELRSAAFGEKSAEDVRELEDQLTKMKTERRKMFNVIQELRGNVRVFARIRPFLPDDNVAADASPSVVPRSEFALKVSNEKGNEHKFSFDKVFAPSVSQEKVFLEVSEFVQSALDGYNVCLFSYGQTGSGKTHTMQGSGIGQMRGIIPRAIEQVGAYKLELERDGWEYTMEVSFLEIYNETIRDLLRDDSSSEAKHEIKVDSNGRRFVTDLTMTPLDPNKNDEIEAVMRTASKHRSVACTDMNAASSRSHSVFTLHLTAINTKLKQTLRGKLNLVDLAGSERLERSGATGKQAKEAMAINKSLSALTTVFTSIGNKASHIPFRDSKLTYLLQPSLSGSGKTLMMVNLSPTEESSGESLCTLRFGAAVNKCELGKPKKSLEDSEDGGNGAGNGGGDKERSATARGRSAATRGGASTPTKGGARSRSSPSKLKSTLRAKSSAIAGKR